ncbi:MAG TPA: ATP-binding cassette domain-containing protein, partial [Patescibacteria group bacterium]|nr:ATP-binding cassette domain-containing protein [Patescibacteria group bacterium]
MKRPLVEVKNVVNRFGRQTVHDGVSLTMHEGEILGLVGGSGSGKSVLLRTILGLNKPQEGQVCVFGKDIYAIDDRERKELEKNWGVLFQDGALFSGLDVLDNIGLP